MGYSSEVIIKKSPSTNIFHFSFFHSGEDHFFHLEGRELYCQKMLGLWGRLGHTIAFFPGLGTS